MKNADLIFEIIPKDLFDIKREGTFQDQIHHRSHVPVFRRKIRGTHADN